MITATNDESRLANACLVSGMALGAFLDGTLLLAVREDHLLRYLGENAVPVPTTTALLDLESEEKVFLFTLLAR